MGGEMKVAGKGLATSKQSIIAWAQHSVTARQPFTRSEEKLAESSFRYHQVHSMAQLQHDGGLPSSLHIIHTSLHECTRKKDLTHARSLQSLIASNGFQSLSIWGDHLIRLFTLCGSLQEANRMFHKVSKPTIYTWHALIAAHIKFGECEKALKLYCVMQRAAVEPDKVTFLCILKACSSMGVMTHGMLIHDKIIRSGLEPNIVVANTLIDMYAKCACVDEARYVFDKLPIRSVVSWGAMIGGYVQNGHSFCAFRLFEDMQQDKYKPNNVTFSCTLKACGSIGALGQGRSLHDLAIKGGLESDILVEGTLIDMYAKCMSLQEAQKVFDRMKHKDIKSWGAMIAGYAQHGPSISALQLFEKMQQKGLKADRVIYMCLSKACQSMGSAREGKLIHEQIIKEGFEKHTIIGNTLIDMHAICGSIDEARNVFDRMPNRDVVSWAAMIAGYVQHECNHAALKLFGCMQQEGLKPDKVTYLWVLKPCGSSGHLGQGRFIHNQILRKGFDSDIMVGSALVDMYASGGSLEEAHIVFNSLPGQNMVSWGGMISGYMQHGHDLLALELFKRMQKEGINLDGSLCVSLLRACGRVGAIDEGKLIHSQLRDDGSELDMIVANTLIEMYSKCGYISEAYKVFDDLPIKNVPCWGAMIAGYVECGRVCLALSLLEKMQQEGLQPDKTIYISICKAFGSIRAVGQGRLVHGIVIRAGLESCLVVGSALIDMYARCASLKEAQNVFANLPNPDVVCWGALIAGYTQHGHGITVLDLFKKMQDTGVQPDRVLFLCVLKACSSVGSIEQGRLIHQQIVDGDLERDVVVVSALVDMYGKCGSLKEAHTLLDKLRSLNAVSCGAMISGYVQHGHGLPALELFEAMQDKGMKPGKATFLCTLKACGNIGAIEQGRLIHDQVVKLELEADVAVGNTLIDMYAKCGSPEEAHKVFNGLTDRDVVSWSATISAYASHGEWEMAFQCLKSMQNLGMKPDDSLFISILSACSHNGLLEEGCQHFMRMKGEHGLAPRIDHYNCVIDILGRGGCLNEAEDLLKSMPIAPNLVAWLTLLTGCRLYGNKELGGQCFDEIKQLDSNDASGYMLLSNLYADSHQFHEVNKLQDLRAGVGALKKPGVAWIEIDDYVHEFIVGRKSLVETGEVYSKFKRTSCYVKGEGFVPLVDIVLEATTTCSGTEMALLSHFERVADLWRACKYPQGHLVGNLEAKGVLKIDAVSG